MWKLLLQLKPLLPHLARLLPLLDIGLGPAQNAGLSNEVRQTVAKIQAIQQRLNIAVQDQSVQLKRLEEELTRLRETSEKQAAAQTKLVEGVRLSRQTGAACRSGTRGSAGGPDRDDRRAAGPRGTLEASRNQTLTDPKNRHGGPREKTPIPDFVPCRIRARARKTGRGAGRPSGKPREYYELRKYHLQSGPRPSSPTATCPTH